MTQADIYYHHRPDKNTPIEETATTLDAIVRSGKALYVGISNYNKEDTDTIARLFQQMGTPFIINQRKYSLFDRTIEKDGLKDYAASNGIGVITFCPLAQGRCKSGQRRDTQRVHPEGCSIRQVRSLHPQQHLQSPWIPRMSP